MPCLLALALPKKQITLLKLARVLVPVFWVGAGLAIGLGAIGVGIAQAGIGSAGAGTLAERPQAFGQILIFLVIPETLIIFAFVIAFFLNGHI